MTEKLTVGAQTLKCASDTTKYDPLEIGHALVEDCSIERGLQECIIAHNPIFNEDEYCVGYVIASDPLIKGVMRRKFFAMLYLPSPRPEQTVFLYNKRKDQITKLLWCLPAAYSPQQELEGVAEEKRPWTMERLYQTTNVPKQYWRMKAWTHAFYDGCFWEFIRHHNKIDLLSEHEYLKFNREKLIKSCGDQISPGLSNASDFAKIAIK